ncbi:MAG TPA: hypothetical protein VIH90_01720 [Candidatus Saccharimonadales bacterium]
MTHEQSQSTTMTVSPALQQMYERMGRSPETRSVDELTSIYGITAADNQLYGQVLKAAYEGTLPFNPVDNVRDFARAADGVEHTSGVGDLEFDTQGVNTPEDIDDTTALRVAQQLRLAKSLGYVVPGGPRIEDGKLKIRFVRPKVEPEGTVRFVDGEYPEHSDGVDQLGAIIPADVIDSLQAGNFQKLNEVLTGSETKLSETIEEILKNAESGKIHMPLQLIERGSVPFYRAVAESLGYSTGTLARELGPDGQPMFGHYSIPIEGRRPGFGEGSQEVPLDINRTVETDEIQQEAYLGPKRELDALIQRLATDPDGLSTEDRQEALVIAKTEARWDATQNKIVVVNGAGEEYLGAEYPNIFSFDGQIRGQYEEVPDDRANWSTGMQLATDMGGKFNDVIIEFDNGEMVHVQKTSGDKVGGKLQTFDITSTKAVKNGVEKQPIKSEALAGVVAIPGERLRMGSTLSEGTVSRVTAFSMDEPSRKSAEQVQFKKPELKRQVIGRFNNALEEAIKTHEAHSLGEVAITGS